MANTQIEELIVAQLTKSPSGPRIPPANLRAVARGLSAFIADDISYSTSVPFTCMNGNMGQQTLTADSDFTPNTSNAQPWASVGVVLVGDGSHVPTFTGFKKQKGSQDYDSTDGVLNVVIFYHDGAGNYWYAITQEATSGSGLIQLSAPGSFTATAAGSSQINLAWSDVSNETNYEIQRSLDGSTGWATINSPVAGATSYNNTGLASSTAYYYRIRAIGDGVTYSNSPWATANATTSASGATTLNAPTGLSAGSITATGLTLSWTDTNSSPQESSVKIYRGTTNVFGSATLIHTEAAGTTSKAITGLSAGTTYYFWVINGGNGTTTVDSTSATTSATTSAGVTETYVPVSDALWTVGSFWSSASFGYEIRYIGPATSDGTVADEYAEIQFTKGFKFEYDHSSLFSGTYGASVDGVSIGTHDVAALGEVIFEEHPNTSSIKTLRIWRAAAGSAPGTQYCVIKGITLYS